MGSPFPGIKISRVQNWQGSKFSGTWKCSSFHFLGVKIWRGSIFREGQHWHGNKSIREQTKWNINMKHAIWNLRVQRASFTMHYALCNLDHLKDTIQIMDPWKCCHPTILATMKWWPTRIFYTSSSWKNWQPDSFGILIVLPTLQWTTKCFFDGNWFLINKLFTAVSIEFGLMNTILYQSYKNQIHAVFKEGHGETNKDRINLKTYPPCNFKSFSFNTFFLLWLFCRETASR